MSEKRVVVTGLGVVSPLGFTIEEFWKRMLAGKTGITTLQSVDTSELKTSVGAEIDSEALSAAMSDIKLRPFDRTVDTSILAARAAVADAGIPIGEAPIPMATILGTGAGSTHSYDDAYKALFEKGNRGLRPTTVPRCMTNAMSSQVSLNMKLTGPNYVIVSACSSSTTTIGTAFRMIKDGYTNKVLCGGADATFSPMILGSWNNLGVMSKNSDPKTACRPFDKDRDGCVLGEGAALFVLESEESAAERNASIYAEVCGFGESSDADHITRPSAEGQTRAMRAALDSASMTPADIGFINAHGTATKANDECESRSIRATFGKHADTIPVASNKSFFGHLLGACGAMETLAVVLGLKNGKVPPNLNLDNQDPDCPITCVGSEAQTIESPVAMKNSFGFGGNNAVLILKRWNA